MIKEKDNERDRFLAESGFIVLRFWNNDVLENLEGVLEVIKKKCHR
jgi:very-short-patch-repair endonuclease